MSKHTAIQALVGLVVMAVGVAFIYWPVAVALFGVACYVDTKWGRQQ